LAPDERAEGGACCPAAGRPGFHDLAYALAAPRISGSRSSHQRVAGARPPCHDEVVEFRFSFLSMGEPFTILASSGQVGYEVRTVADVAEHLSVRAVGGAEVVAVVRDAMTSGFQVLADDEKVALVRAKGRFRRRYLIDGGGEPLSVTGDVYNGWYELRAGGRTGWRGFRCCARRSCDRSALGSMCGLPSPAGRITCGSLRSC
jgi:hypothetical protein